MPLYPKTSVVPPGGWHFPDSSTGADIVLQGDSDVDLAQRVLRHRLQNNLPPGNPVQEIADYVCSRHPHFCADTSPQPQVPPSGAGGGSFATRVMSWIARFYSGASHDPGVSQAEANRRAAICIGCPNNRNYKAGGCGACIEQVERLSHIWRRGRATPQDAGLGGCVALDQHNATAVWAAQLGDAGETSIGTVLIPECWRGPK